MPWVSVYFAEGRIVEKIRKMETRVNLSIPFQALVRPRVNVDIELCTLPSRSATSETPGSHFHRECRKPKIESYFLQGASRTFRKCSFSAKTCPPSSSLPSPRPENKNINTVLISLRIKKESDPTVRMSMVKKYPNTRRRNEMPLIKRKTAKRTKGEVFILFQRGTSAR